MLTIKEIKEALKQNELALQEARAKNSERIPELLTQRSLLKDTLIEIMEQAA